jgi:PTH1 family peptidyl-tRNA hydrolase
VRSARPGGGDDEARLVVVGLGNPGARYELTRHNAGALTLDVLLRRRDASLKRHKSGCVVAETAVGGRPVVLARPLAFMNESGRPVRQVVSWYGASPERLVVVHDELDISFGTVRVKLGGGTAGHNGLSSIVSHLGTPEFGRVRIGISRPTGGRDPVAWVLSDFSASERRQLPEILDRAADAVERIAEVGLDAAMNEFNIRSR